MDKALLENFLSKQKALNVYPLGDLEEPFWSQSEYFALFNGGQIKEVVVLYHGMKPPSS